MGHFLELCWSDDQTKRPSFELIFEELLNEKYIIYFGVSKKMIDKYLSQFDESLKMKKSASKFVFNSLSNEKYEDIMDSSELLHIAIKFDKGKRGFEIDQEMACKYYQKACDMGNSKAMSLYCHKLKKRIGIPPNKKKALILYKNFADIGNIKAMYQNGKMLFIGDDIESNKKEAIKYIKNAAENGCQKAKIFMKNHLESEYELSDDDIENVEIKFEYAQKLLKGDGVPENKKKEAHIFKKIADSGDAKAMFNYGMMLFLGDGIKIDKHTGINYIKMSADEGYDHAMLKYGDILYNGDGIEKNKEESAEYYKMAANKNNSEAALKYAVMFIDGDVIKRDMSKAAKFMKIAADQKNVTAMYNYGVMLFKGDGVKTNEKLAIRYIIQAMNNGSKEAAIFYNKFILNDEEDNESEACDEEDNESETNDDNIFDSIEKSSFTIYNSNDNINFSISFDSDSMNTCDISQIKNKQYAIGNMQENSEKTRDNGENSRNFSIFIKRMTSILFDNVIIQCNMKTSDINNANLIVYDGILKNTKYKKFNPSIYINKIPNLCYICLKKNFFKSLYIMKSKFPNLYKNFIPVTYQIPEDIDKFHEIIQLKRNKWVLKLDKICTVGIKLISNQNDIDDKLSKSIIQSFISPYLIDGYKFDLRFYLLITNLDPLTLYMYDEEIAYFCSEPFKIPTCENMN